MRILFINGSPNKEGNTAALAEVLLSGKEYKTLNLTDYRIGSYGQNFPDDQLDVVIEKMKESDAIVIGSPLYWHNICGSVRNILDRFYWYGGGRLSFRTDAVFSLSGRRTGKVDDGCRNGSEPF